MPYHELAQYGKLVALSCTKKSCNILADVTYRSYASLTIYGLLTILLEYLKVFITQLPSNNHRLHSLQSNSLVKMSGFGLTVHIAVSHDTWFPLKGQLEEVWQDLKGHTITIYPRYFPMFYLFLYLFIYGQQIRVCSEYLYISLKGWFQSLCELYFQFSNSRLKWSVLCRYLD